MREKRITDAGKFLMELCDFNDETMSDMAEKLGVSKTFLTHIKYGKKPMPSTWYHKLSTIYFLSDEQKKRLDRVIFLQRNRSSIDLTVFNDYEKDCILNYVYEIYKNT